MSQQQQLIILLTVAVGVFIGPAFADDWMHPSAPFRGSSRRVDQEYEPPDSWNRAAQEALTNKLRVQPIIKQAKNAIMFLGDGWGVSTLTPARILRGQEIEKVPFGEEGQLHVDTFPASGTSKTYCVNSQVADSACTATAYLCGVKANYGTIGVSSDVTRGDCAAQQRRENQVESILKWAQEAGKSTGIITTSRITDASPTGTYAHIATRDWECDADVERQGQNSTICDDIAEQLILSEPGRNFEVILGGGRVKFLKNDTPPVEGELGQRGDQDLVQKWLNDNAALNASYVMDAAGLRDVDPSTTDRLLGLFAPMEMAYFHDQEENGDPSLTEMTIKAIQILKKNPNGFFLFVEGGRIDHGHHANQGMRALWESVEFDLAIQTGDEMTKDDEDTLIVVTADHSHSFSFAGYAPRGASLDGMAGIGTNDGLPYATLNYANGPGWKEFTNNSRHNLTDDDTADMEYRQVPLVPLDSDTHGGEDVMVFAKGPFSHLFNGVQQQNYIPHAMAYATCIGSGQTFCNDNE